MSIERLLVLLLALALALDVAMIAGILARGAGQSCPKAVLTGGAAALSALTVFFAAQAVYG